MRIFFIYFEDKELKAFYNEFDPQQKRIVKLVMFLLIGFVISLNIFSSFKETDEYQKSKIEATKVLIKYDTIYYAHRAKPSFQIQFTNNKIYHFSFHANSGTYLHEIIKQGDIVYKDSNSNEMFVIKGSQTFTGYFNADTNNISWKKKKLINEDIY